MNAYWVSLLLGAAGFTTMAVSGLARQGHARGGRSGRGGRAHGRGAKSGRAPVARGRGSSARNGLHGARAALGHLVLSLTSPRFVFSVALGLGLTGVVAQRFTHATLLPVIALAGGLLFERALVRPLWDSLMRFGSEPALTLESCCGDDATALTAFDANGHGIVSVQLDGQVVQLLAQLQRAHATDRPRIGVGTRLRIEDVDAARNRCTVSL